MRKITRKGPDGKFVGVTICSLQELSDINWGRRPELEGKFVALSPTGDFYLGRNQYGKALADADVDLVVIGTTMVPKTWLERRA